jgi:pilus assembly protein Flp/PilA
VERDVAVHGRLGSSPALGGAQPLGSTLRKGVKRRMFNGLKNLATSLVARLGLVKEEGQALVEYALILALVSVVAIGTLEAIGTGVLAKLGEVSGAL